MYKHTNIRCWQSRIGKGFAILPKYKGVESTPLRLYILEEIGQSYEETARNGRTTSLASCSSAAERSTIV